MTPSSPRATRAGFSVLELFVVIVILGLLIAIAIPRYAAYRSKASSAAMVTDLHNLASAQAAYWAAKGAYSPDTLALKFTHSPATSIRIIAADASGWSASMTREGSAVTCSIFYGSALPLPPATIKNVIGCTR